MNQKYFSSSIFICLLTWQHIFASPTHARLSAQNSYLNNMINYYKKQEPKKHPEDCETKPPSKYSSSDFSGSHRKKKSLATNHNAQKELAALRPRRSESQ